MLSPVTPGRTIKPDSTQVYWYHGFWPTPQNYGSSRKKWIEILPFLPSGVRLFHFCQTVTHSTSYVWASPTPKMPSLTPQPCTNSFHASENMRGGYILLISLCCCHLCWSLLSQPTDKTRRQNLQLSLGMTLRTRLISSHCLPSSPSSRVAIDGADNKNHSSNWPAPQAGQGSDRDLFDGNILLTKTVLACGSSLP